MNKESFLAAIRERLNGLPQGDIDRSLDYYSEMIDDCIEDGMTAEEAVASMGSADEIAGQILMDTPLPKLIKAKVNPPRSLRVWEIVLLVLGSPLWISLLAAAAAIVLSVYIVIWAAVITLYAADLALAVGGFAGIIGCIVLALTGQTASALLALAAGLVCAGIAVLLFLAFNQVTRGVVKLSILLLRWIKGLFIKK